MKTDITKRMNMFVKTDCGVDWNPKYLECALPTGFGAVFKSRIGELYNNKSERDTSNKIIRPIINEDLGKLVEAAGILGQFGDATGMVSKDDADAFNVRFIFHV